MKYELEGLKYDIETENKIKNNPFMSKIYKKSREIGTINTN